MIISGSLSTFVFSQLNALANRAAGKGYENEDNYSNIRFQFVGIENIHVMRGSLAEASGRSETADVWEIRFILITFCQPLCFCVSYSDGKRAHFPWLITWLDWKTVDGCVISKAIMDAAIFLARVKTLAFLRAVLCPFLQYPEVFSIIYILLKYLVIFLISIYFIFSVVFFV